VIDSIGEFRTDRSSGGGASVRAVQKLLGHASLLSTQAYLDVEVSDLASMLERAIRAAVVLR